jgi:hypothetical protein
MQNPKQTQNSSNTEEIDPLDAFMDNLYTENKTLLESNNLHLVKSQTDYREELYQQYLTQHDSIQKTRREMDLPETKGPENSNKVVKGISGTKFVKGEMLFTNNQIKQGNDQYILGETVDLKNSEEMVKASKNKWNINNMFKNYFSKRDTSIKR